MEPGVLFMAESERKYMINSTLLLGVGLKIVSTTPGREVQEESFRNLCSFKRELGVHGRAPPSPLLYILR